MTENPTKLKASDLAALMCGRICHDLVSPVGALSTALEVLDDESNVEMHEDALDLVRLSARQASAKLQYLRVAFGAGTSAPGVMGVEKLKALVEGMYGEGKVKVAWETPLDGLEKSYARLLLNMIMFSMQTIPRGGKIQVRADMSEGMNINLTATGPKARVDEKLSLALKGQAPEGGFDGRAIQSFYTGLMVREMKGKIAVSLDGETTLLSSELPALSAQTAA